MNLQENNTVIVRSRSPLLCYLDNEGKPRERLVLDQATVLRADPQMQTVIVRLHSTGEMQAFDRELVYKPT